MSLLLNNVLKNPYIWGMALTYFFIYVVRQGVTSWFVFYLIKVGHLPHLGSSIPLHWKSDVYSLSQCLSRCTHCNECQSTLITL